jgi:hypothetical protein
MKRVRLYVDEHGRLAMSHAGFSWLAAISLPFWALQRRLYALALAAFLLSGAINLWFVGASMQALAFVLQSLAFGAFANRPHRWHLERGGWRVTAEEPGAVVPAPTKPLS